MHLKVAKELSYMLLMQAGDSLLRVCQCGVVTR